MFEFQQYLGFLLFLTILTIGFWLMIFLVGFVQYWVGGAIIELIKEKRLRGGLTQSALSELTGITIRTIQRIENNEVVPSLHSLKKIGEALQIDLLEQPIESETTPKTDVITIKLTSMDKLLTDLKTLFKNHWKLILKAVLVFWLLSNYTDIKKGILDAWGGN
jgi:transcriptional regulator with XRE-family HTH domain